MHKSIMLNEYLEKKSLFALLNEADVANDDTLFNDEIEKKYATKIKTDLLQLQKLLTALNMNETAGLVKKFSTNVIKILASNNNEESFHVVKISNLILMSFSNLFLKIASNVKTELDDNDETKFNKSIDEDSLDRLFRKFFVPNKAANDAFNKEYEKIKKDIISKNESKKINQNSLNEGILDFIKNFFKNTEKNPLTSKTIAIAFRNIAGTDSGGLLKTFLSDHNKSNLTAKDFLTNLAKQKQLLSRMSGKSFSKPATSSQPADQTMPTQPTHPTKETTSGNAIGSVADSTKSKPVSKLADVLNIKGNSDKKRKLKSAIDIAQINIPMPAGFSAEEKQKLAKALKPVEIELREKMRNMIESTSNESDDLIMERWQALAGIEK